MMLELSKRKKLLLLTYRKGYRVLPSGVVVNSADKPRKLKRVYRSAGVVYLGFGMKDPTTGKVVNVMVHQLAALQKFGAEKFLAAQCVRHLNGNSLDNSLANIALGTFKDNSGDIPESTRQRCAELASFRNIREDWHAIDADRAAGMSYRQLSVKYRISKGTLSYRYGAGKYKSKRIDQGPPPLAPVI